MTLLIERMRDPSTRKETKRWRFIWEKDEELLRVFFKEIENL